MRRTRRSTGSVQRRLASAGKPIPGEGFGDRGPLGLNTCCAPADCVAASPAAAAPNARKPRRLVGEGTGVGTVFVATPDGSSVPVIRVLSQEARVQQRPPSGAPNLCSPVA